MGYSAIAGNVHSTYANKQLPARDDQQSGEDEVLVVALQAEDHCNDDAVLSTTQSDRAKRERVRESVNNEGEVHLQAEVGGISCARTHDDEHRQQASNNPLRNGGLVCC